MRLFELIEHLQEIARTKGDMDVRLSSYGHESLLLDLKVQQYKHPFSEGKLNILLEGK